MFFHKTKFMFNSDKRINSYKIEIRFKIGLIKVELFAEKILLSVNWMQYGLKQVPETIKSRE
ncbi:hypothetical protein B1222_22045 [Paenibacillus larvae subsp. pulvifaciens]|uniref:Uncharacterized protein n=1 Tax=Paenibacillus larvae subsp. pulvifaciens TaxID=1477 RepID=A0A1V0UPB1_9BACL|nr:hypothetical protein B1222_22045 [Paenibacillus larvae subsp. pulvifaciens]ARF66798.1 hypothetical protein B7C51_01670 [Paenibacillus larvae subsp. pulvifaciens]